MLTPEKIQRIQGLELTSLADKIETSVSLQALQLSEEGFETSDIIEYLQMEMIRIVANTVGN